MAINVLLDDYLKREEFRLLIRLENVSIFYGKEGRLDGGLGAMPPACRQISHLPVACNSVAFPECVIWGTKMVGMST